MKGDPQWLGVWCDAGSNICQGQGHQGSFRVRYTGTNSKLPVETLQQENTSSHLIQTRIDDGLWILLCMPCNRILSL